MKFYRLRKDIFINMDAIHIAIDMGYRNANHLVRIYTSDGRHEYELSNEEWTKFQEELKAYEMGKK